MKKAGLLVLLAVLVGAAAWIGVNHRPRIQPRSLMVDEIVYDVTDQQTEAPAEDAILGQVVSCVEQTQLPKVSGQANFPEAQDQPYSMVEGQLILQLGESWYLCVQVFG